MGVYSQLRCRGVYPATRPTREHPSSPSASSKYIYPFNIIYYARAVVRGGEVIKINELSDWCWQRRAPVGGSLFTVGCCGCSSIAAALAVLSFRGVGCGIHRARVMAGPSGPRLMTSRCRGGFGGMGGILGGKGGSNDGSTAPVFPRRAHVKRFPKDRIACVLLLYNTVRCAREDFRQKYRAVICC